MIDLCFDCLCWNILVIFGLGWLIALFLSSSLGLGLGLVLLRRDVFMMVGLGWAGLGWAGLARHEFDIPSFVSHFSFFSICL